MAGLKLRLVVCSTTCRITSGSQVTPNIALTVIIIKVTRFRTFNTPFMKKNNTTLQVILKFAGAKNILSSVKGPFRYWDCFNSSVKIYLSYVGSTRLSQAIRPSLSINYAAIKKIWKSDHQAVLGKDGSLLLTGLR